MKIQILHYIVYLVEYCSCCISIPSFKKLMWHLNDHSIYNNDFKLIFFIISCGSCRVTVQDEMYNLVKYTYYRDETHYFHS